MKLPSRAALALLVVLLLSGSPAFAGEAEKKAALDLMTFVMPRPTYDAMMRQMTDGMLQSFGAQGIDMPPDTAAKIHKALAEVMSYQEVMEWSAEVYAARFTAAELKELKRFYQTKVGQKLARALPELTGEVGRKVATMLPERLPAALERAGLAPGQ